MQHISKPTGLKRIVYATGHSLRACQWLLKNEAAFRQEVLIIIPLLAVIYFTPTSLAEKCILLASALFVLFAEVVNTAIEATIDRIGAERHKLSGLAKDLGSFAVLLSIKITALIWLSILLF